MIIQSQSIRLGITTTEDRAGNATWEFHVDRDGTHHGLSDEQCQLAFPKLFVELDKSAGQRREKKGTPIRYEEIAGPLDDAMVRGVIYEGDLYILDVQGMKATFSRARATLSSLHRALQAFPGRRALPNIEFILTTEDFVQRTNEPVWAYSKRAVDEDKDAVWLMPDFGYWAWPEVQIGPYEAARQRIAAVDAEVPFAEKKKQLVWRGSLAPSPELRGRLLRAARGTSWASIRVLDWEDADDVRLNLLPIEDHCRYMFLAHTEGRSFSGRGKYLLNCRSVMVSHRLEWREAHHAALVASGPEANFVEVERDWSDLERKIEYLIDHPDVAEKIADNAIRTFRDRYLTPAAESCYWRHLIRQYASVCDFEPELYTSSEGRKQLRGIPFETWILS
ncbi:hypothetical protein ASPZODRAFT_152378 [Penicilliopsis zonata CBS 506.65]|uniref:Glycosyl transferase CAP10 domain-containing protein n=1 Tax=Penicilliopsis zonata CBS 506.65 TaxID=1073090 RepID=A0A1L9SGC9_9EURO|nr:hypothetical protein ASPZODRAFT_152378 [Penicilliopsis zonata CBS 506.65]OJJ46173.1 hypothetical protein ASPZODRAFT_152378 [Penicilliopsis zonata CBS 506.65]